MVMFPSLYIDIPTTPKSPPGTLHTRRGVMQQMFVNIFSLTEKRQEVKIRSYLTAVTIGLLSGFTTLIVKGITETAISRKEYPALALIMFVPTSIIYFSYAANSIVNNIYTIFSSMKILSQNSTYYSAVKTICDQPAALQTFSLLHAPKPHQQTQDCTSTSSKSSHLSVVKPVKSGIGAFVGSVFQMNRSIPSMLPLAKSLPFVLVHMPVYKESLRDVISLSCDSIFTAMEDYRQQGGTCRLLISDDGLQCISVAEQQERIDYYNHHNITYIARPVTPRAGKFKKASNMNHSLRICEEYMKGGVFLTDTMSEGNLAIPENTILLLLDADTKIPQSAIVDTIPEFIVDSNLPYTQHFTMPFPIPQGREHDYWLTTISHFTENIYRIGIGFSTALGGCCPLVGHNAFIRYAALKEEGFWSEDSVCEDFDLFLRLAMRGKYGRYVIYTGPDFQEGVSLTFRDEITKFRKFAYGACEMCLNPFAKWLRHGPITHGFIQFLRSPINWHTKLNVVFYISTYFAMANAFYFAICDGFLQLWYREFYKNYMARSFDIMFSCIAIFAGLSTVSQIVFDMRILKQPNILRAIWNECKWIPTFTIFFSSMMFHMTEIAFAYMFGLPVTWGATNKDPIEKETIMQSVGKTIKQFRLMYCMFCPIMALYGYAYFAKKGTMYMSWALFYYIAIHLVAPIIFNPSIIDSYIELRKRKFL